MKMHRPNLAILLLLSFFPPDVRAANFTLPLDRPYSMRNLEPAQLEDRYHAMVLGLQPLDFTFPRACRDEDGSQDRCRLPRIRHGHPDSGDGIGIGFLGGGEYRSLSQSGTAAEVGAITSGGKGPASFYLDARMFTETSEGGPARSYDREDMDVQDESATGTVSYNSYARYRGSMALDLGFGRFSVARDAVHWGPGQLHNLTFHQDAVPFHQYSFSTRLGPLSVTSLYGDLAVAPSYIDTLNLKERNLYAHRYEMRAGKNLLLGVSEQIILYDENKPFLFTPIFPLFIAKAFMYEHMNNGNISVDASYRVANSVALYGEFLLDDLESPSSLLTKDYVQNKWAAMAGAHYAAEVAGGPAGLIVEYSHIEPWVYSHFAPFTAQTAHLGYPLGNQAGPNSRSITGKAYARRTGSWYASARVSLLWKGRDPGSGVDDVYPGHQLDPKAFLADVDGPSVEFSPVVTYSWGWLHAFLSGVWGDRTELIGGVRAYY